MPVTIKDVAALAGVSPSTVSRTCKDHPSISRQTKEKVRQAMAKLGYEPNFQASSLATQNSRTVGIILPPSEWEAYQNPFYLEMIRGISQYCNQKQYINTVITGQNEDEILQAIKTMARTGLAEGFIVLYSREQDPVLDYLYEEGLLYVLIGKACRNVNQTIYVDNDNVLAGREAADYLFGLGHRRIAYLSGDHSLLFNKDRKSGYLLSLAEQVLVRGICRPMTVSMGADRWTQEPTAILCICNGRHYGGGFMPVADAMPDDGVLDVLRVGKVSLPTFARLAGQYAKGLYWKYPALIRAYHGQEVSFSAREPITVVVDGEIMQDTTFTVRLSEKKVNFFYPAGASYAPCV